MGEQPVRHLVGHAGHVALAGAGGMRAKERAGLGIAQVALDGPVELVEVVPALEAGQAVGLPHQGLQPAGERGVVAGLVAERRPAA